MSDERFFRSSRGRIIETLRKRGPCTVDELSEAIGVSPNAIRQHLAVLERDDLVSQDWDRRGPTKPCHVYSLTEAGERLFPKRHDALLNAVLKEIVRQDGLEKVEAIFRNIGVHWAAHRAPELAGRPIAERVEAAVEMLCQAGSMAEFEQGENGFLVREHNCPYFSTAVEHPQVCTVVRTMLECLLEVPVAQTRTSGTPGGAQCVFVVDPPAADGR